MVWTTKIVTSNRVCNRFRVNRYIAEIMTRLFTTLVWYIYSVHISDRTSCFFKYLLYTCIRAYNTCRIIACLFKERHVLSVYSIVWKRRWAVRSNIQMYCLIFLSSIFKATVDTDLHYDTVYGKSVQLLSEVSVSYIPRLGPWNVACSKRRFWKDQSSRYLLPFKHVHEVLKYNQQSWNFKMRIIDLFTLELRSYSWQALGLYISAGYVIFKIVFTYRYQKI